MKVRKATFKFAQVLLNIHTITVIHNDLVKRNIIHNKLI